MQQNEDPVRRIIFGQGRTLTWVAGQLGISVNYLHRLLQPPGHPDGKTPQPWFYPRLAALLGVSEEELRWPEPTKDEVPA